MKNHLSLTTALFLTLSTDCTDKLKDSCCTVVNIQMSCSLFSVSSRAKFQVPG